MIIILKSLEKKKSYVTCVVAIDCYCRSSCLHYITVVDVVIWWWLSRCYFLSFHFNVCCGRLGYYEECCCCSANGCDVIKCCCHCCFLFTWYCWFLVQCCCSGSDCLLLFWLLSVVVVVVGVSFSVLAVAVVV